MSSQEFKRASDVPFAPQGEKGEALKFAYLGPDDLKIEVESPSRSRSRMIGTDIVSALKEHGLPAAQVRIVQHVEVAQATNQPLACALSL